MDELTIGDKVYISSKKAASITGYAKDYIGQLCREGRVEATLVGRSWYVLEESIRNHRFGKEELKNEQIVNENTEKDWIEPIYQAEKTDFLPELSKVDKEEKGENDESVNSAEVESVANMQNVWKEWFEKRASGDQKKEVYEEESRVNELYDGVGNDAPEIHPTEDSTQVEEEYQVSIHRNLKTENGAHSYVQDIIPIEKSYLKTGFRREVHADEAGEEAYREKSAVQRSHGNGRGGGLISKAIIVGITIVIVSVSMVSLGLVRSLYDDKSPFNKVLNYLGGTRIISK